MVLNSADLFTIFSQQPHIVANGASSCPSMDVTALDPF